jgi:hypothetical protein
LDDESKPYSERLSLEERDRKVAKEMRSFILKRNQFNEQDLFALDLSKRCGYEALWHLIPIFCQCPQEELSRRFMRRVMEALVGWGNEHDDINWELEYR